MCLRIDLAYNKNWLFVIIIYFFLTSLGFLIVYSCKSRFFCSLPNAVCPTILVPPPPPSTFSITWFALWLPHLRSVFFFFFFFWRPPSGFIWTSLFVATCCMIYVIIFIFLSLLFFLTLWWATLALFFLWAN
jgi:hypothetical protein